MSSITSCRKDVNMCWLIVALFIILDFDTDLSRSGCRPSIICGFPWEALLGGQSWGWRRCPGQRQELLQLRTALGLCHQGCTSLGCSRGGCHPGSRFLEVVHVEKAGAWFQTLVTGAGVGTDQRPWCRLMRHMVVDLVGVVLGPRRQSLTGLNVCFTGSVVLAS